MAYQKQTYQDGVTEYTDTLYEHMDDGIFGAYPVQLIAISDTAPSQCVENDKYYNTSTKKIYTATGTNTWGTNGETPLEDTAYWLISENGSYAWNGTDLVSIGGGKAEVVISDEEPEEGKLWVDTAEIQTIAGRDRLVNVSNEVDEEYRVNFLKNKKNLFNGLLELGTYSNEGVKSGSTSNYRNVNAIKVKPNTTYTFSINGVAQNYAVYLYNSSMTFLNGETTATFTTPANCEYLNFRCFNADFTSDFNNLKIQLEEGSTATTYEAPITPAIYVDNEEIYRKEVDGKGIFTHSSINYGDAFYHKLGNLVIVNIQDLQVSTAIPSSSQTKIGEGFPKNISNENHVAEFGVLENYNNGSTAYTIRVIIDTNGDLLLNYSGIPTNQRFYGTFVYITNE